MLWNFFMIPSFLGILGGQIDCPAPTFIETEITQCIEEFVCYPLAGQRISKTPENLGNFSMTFYWTSVERNEERSVQLYSKNCKPLVKVGKRFAQSLKMEGSGRLRDGRVLNTSGNCDCPNSPCYSFIPKNYRWGIGPGTNPLTPFRSIAVDPQVIPIGTRIYIPELDGKRMPGNPPWGGFVHNGCVIAQDKGGGVKGNQIDFFVARSGFFRALYRTHNLKKVEVFKAEELCRNFDTKKPRPKPLS